jgi:hypothetical protein
MAKNGQLLKSMGSKSNLDDQSCYSVDTSVAGKKSNVASDNLAEPGLLTSASRRGSEVSISRKVGGKKPPGPDEASEERSKSELYEQLDEVGTQLAAKKKT